MYYSHNGRKFAFGRKRKTLTSAFGESFLKFCASFSWRACGFQRQICNTSHTSHEACYNEILNILKVTFGSDLLPAMSLLVPPGCGARLCQRPCHLAGWQPGGDAEHVDTACKRTGPSSPGFPSGKQSRACVIRATALCPLFKDGQSAWSP